MFIYTIKLTFIEFNAKSYINFLLCLFNSDVVIVLALTSMHISNQNMSLFRTFTISSSSKCRAEYIIESFINV